MITRQIKLKKKIFIKIKFCKFFVKSKLCIRKYKNIVPNDNMTRYVLSKLNSLSLLKMRDNK